VRLLRVKIKSELFRLLLLLLFHKRILTQRREEARTQREIQIRYAGLTG
jgi:hypothetical protein